MLKDVKVTREEVEELYNCDSNWNKIKDEKGEQNKFVELMRLAKMSTGKKMKMTTCNK